MQGRAGRWRAGHNRRRRRPALLQQYGRGRPRRGAGDDCSCCANTQAMSRLRNGT